MSQSVVTESVVNTANPAPGSARNPMHAGGSDLRMLAQVEKWMAVIREINREQQESCFDIQAPGEPAMNSGSATVGPPHEIKIDKSHRVLNSPASSRGYTFYGALILGLLATTCAVGWFILYESALPFGLTSVSGLTGNRDLSPKAISSTLEHSSSSTTSITTAPISRLASKDSTIASRRTDSTGDKVKEARTPTKLTPTPETRPTTIEGWALREVVNGTAVIEGPNGVWKVTLGQTVPGIGRVDSIVRWGNRLIVATSRGLISTP